MTAREPETRTYPGPAFRTISDYAWRLLVVGTVGYFVIRLLSTLSLVVIPFVVSILVASVLHPLSARMRRAGLGRGVSTVLTMLSAVVVLGGLLTIVIVRAAQQAPQLGDEINNLLPHVKHWLIDGPLKLNATTVNNLNQTVSDDITKNSSAIASTALSTGKTVLELLSGLVLGIFSTIFLVYDGDRVWAFLLKGVPATARPGVDAAGHAAWHTVSYYIRGTLIVALFHGLVVAVTLTILGVPLAFPLAVLVALGSLVPLIGAVVTGVLAVAVAGLSQGLVAAIVMTAVLLLDNQIEAHVLQPFVVGRYVRIHPLAVVLSLAAGGILFGLVGAILAVPVVACVNSAIRAALAVAERPAISAAILVKPSQAAAATESPPPGSPLHGLEDPAVTAPVPDMAPGVPTADSVGEPLAEITDPPREGG
ncbi:MAG TPA: AI-2E family transporter [Acidimicrobiales bacterium]|nr:AI-2E family transporter [Acidimicrobiales bacterium]